MKRLLTDEIMDETYTDIKQYFVNSSFKKSDFIDVELNKIYKEERDIKLSSEITPFYDNIEVRYYIFSNHIDHDENGNPCIKGPSHFKVIGKDGSKDKIAFCLLHLHESNYEHFIKNTSLIDNLLVNIARSTFEKDLKHALEDKDGKSEAQISFAISQSIKKR